MTKAKSEHLSRWKRHIVVNSMQARCASVAWRQINIKWRASETVGRDSINGLNHNRPSTRFTLSLALSPSCAHSLLRSFIRLHGVNHYQPFPTASIFHNIFSTYPF